MRSQQRGRRVHRGPYILAVCWCLLIVSAYPSFPSSLTFALFVQGSATASRATSYRDSVATRIGSHICTCHSRTVVPFTSTQIWTTHSKLFPMNNFCKHMLFAAQLLPSHIHPQNLSTTILRWSSNIPLSKVQPSSRTQTWTTATIQTLLHLKNPVAVASPATSKTASSSTIRKIP